MLSHVQLFATPWTAARQASLPLIISPSLPEFMSIELAMPHNHLILCHILVNMDIVFRTCYMTITLQQVMATILINYNGVIGWSTTSMRLKLEEEVRETKKSMSRKEEDEVVVWHHQVGSGNW